MPTRHLYPWPPVPVQVLPGGLQARSVRWAVHRAERKQNGRCRPRRLAVAPRRTQGSPQARSQGRMPAQASNQRNGVHGEARGGKNERGQIASGPEVEEMMGLDAATNVSAPDIGIGCCRVKRRCLSRNRNLKPLFGLVIPTTAEGSPRRQRLVSGRSTARVQLLPTGVGVRSPRLRSGRHAWGFESSSTPRTMLDMVLRCVKKVGHTAIFQVITSS